MANTTAGGGTKIMGMKELTDLINNLPRSINKYNEWKKVWRKVGKPAQQAAQGKIKDAKEAIPYPPNKTNKIEPGTLRNSIQFFTTKATKDMLGMYLGPRVKGKYRGHRGGYYGAWLEYGGSVKFFGKYTSHDRKFLEPAFNLTKGSMMSTALKEGEAIAFKAIKKWERETKKYGKVFTSF